MLGPMVNLARVPEGARNFEAFGEDPWLTSRMVEQSIAGLQSQGVMACVKHFICNDFDGIKPSSRFNISMNMNDSTLYMYLMPFDAAVRAGALSIMCSYNRVNNVFACENPHTLGLLKNLLGFQGFVVSDWGATHSTVPCAMAGMDVEMPDGQFFGEPLAAAVQNGTVPLSVLNDKVLRVLYAYYSIGLFDRNTTGNLTTPSTSPAHNALARRLTAAATVLLQNRGNVLPLPKKGPLRIAVIGDEASSQGDMFAGGGSGGVKAPYVIGAFEAIRAVVQNMTGGASVTYTGSNLFTAYRACQKADVCIVVVGVRSAEGGDRHNLSLGLLEELLVEEVAKAGRKTVVVIHSGGAIYCPWASRVNAILAMGFPGQEDGNGLADILWGIVNPSAKLTLSWPASENQLQLTPEQWPGVAAQDPCINECRKRGPQTVWPFHSATYSEGLQIGYRAYAAKGLLPAWAFGYGLSYTEFAFSDLVGSICGSTRLCFNFTVNNTGTCAGATVPQLYIAFPAVYAQPPWQLKGFLKTDILEPNQAKSYGMSLNVTRDLLVWQEGGPSLAKGTFIAYLAKSSVELVANVTFFVGGSLMAFPQFYINVSALGATTIRE